MGTTCGRREREADAGNEEERSSPVPAVCNGGRHPGLRDADRLRGLSEERRSWSVRLGCVGLVPCRRSHRRQQVSSGRKRRGTSSACAKRTHSSWQRLKSASTLEDTSFARSRDPCTSIVTKLFASGASRWRGVWRGGRDIAVGKTLARGRNRHRDHDCPDACAARRVSPFLFRGATRGQGVGVRRQKRKVVMAIVPARKRELGLVARTSK